MIFPAALSLKILLIVVALFWSETGSGLVQRTKSSRPAKTTASNSIKKYVLIPTQSRITILLTQEGLIRKIHPEHHVAVRNFQGRIQMPLKDESKASVELEADAKSCVNVDTDMKDFERSGFQKVLHEEVLASDRFPAIKFRSVSITNIQKSGSDRSFILNGELTLRNVTKRVSFPVKITIQGNQLRATGEENIKQSDFGITPYSGAMGAIKIGDQIKVSFTVVANEN